VPRAKLGEAIPGAADGICETSRAVFRAEARRRMARLFAAIALDDEVRQFALGVSERLANAQIQCRFERPDKLHITLAFLGSIPAERITPFGAALAQAASESEPFRLRLDRLGGFPERRPTLLWLGSRARDKAYAACALRVRVAFAALGSRCAVNDEPHVTLCRSKRPLPAVPPMDLEPGVAFLVRELTLYESLPGGSTTRYEVRSVAQLGRS
jgi:RNA 2',3'-cyclic 3'-phosphodiesterase